MTDYEKNENMVELNAEELEEVSGGKGKKKFVKTTGQVNVRKGPSLDSASIGVLAAGTIQVFQVRLIRSGKRQRVARHMLRHLLACRGARDVAGASRDMAKDGLFTESRGVPPGASPDSCQPSP